MHNRVVNEVNGQKGCPSGVPGAIRVTETRSYHSVRARLALHMV